MAKKTKSETISLTRTLRAEIVCSPDMAWAELGPRLRAWRSLVSHMVNEAVFRCREAERDQVAARAADVDKDDMPPGPATAAYQACADAQADFQAWARRAKGLSDAERGRLSTVAFGGASQSCIGQEAFGYFKKWKKERNSIPSAGRGQPIPCRAAETKFYEDDSGKLILDARIGPNEVPRSRFVLAVSRGWHWEQLRKIVSGECRHGQVDIVLDERAVRKNGGKGKWYALISYSFAKPERPEKCDPDGMLVMHRGMHNALQFLGSDGEGSGKTTIRGNKLQAYKRRCKAIRRSMGSVSAPERGDGAKGRGIARRYEHAQKLLDAEARHVRTFCQQSAARAIELAIQWRKGVIVIEDYGGIEPSDDRGERRFFDRFPYYQLKQAIVCAAEGAGLEVREVPAAYISQTCPRCGNQDASQRLHRTGMFHCAVCEFDRTADMVAAIHMLRLAGPKNNGWDGKLRKEHEAAKRLRKPDAGQSEEETEKVRELPKAKKRKPPEDAE